MSAMLEIGDLHVSYGQVDAVRGVSLSLAHGQIVSVIGPNGAGKTTLLAAVMGLLPSRGTLRFEGEDLRGLDVEARVERGLCLVPEKRELFGELSVLDNLMLGAYARRAGSATLRQGFDVVYGRFPRLAERRRQRADTLSGGERQMLALGRALVGRPRLLLLDEPSLGLAPRVTAQIMALLRQLRDDTNLTVLLVEQNVRSALSVADQGIVMSLGRIVVATKASELREDENLRHAYLGF